MLSGASIVVMASMVSTMHMANTVHTVSTMHMANTVHMANTMHGLIMVSMVSMVNVVSGVNPLRGRSELSMLGGRNVSISGVVRKQGHRVDVLRLMVCEPSDVGRRSQSMLPAGHPGGLA